jgi:hypothetical protein
MLKRIAASLIIAATGILFAPSRAAAGPSFGVSVNIGLFHERLAPYGEWVSVGRYGSCWRPFGVARGWRPYTIGAWAYTDDGWSWESDEDWGWATYHYGRWVYDPYYGWVWIPGTIWAPAYVAWRYGDDWIGWAPLPPEIDPWYDVEIDHVVAPSSFVFVEARFFTDRSLVSHFAPAWRTPTLVAATRNATRYDVRGGRLINRGVEPRVIERAVGRPIVPVVSTRARDAERSAIARPRTLNEPPSSVRPSVERRAVERPSVERRRDRETTSLDRRPAIRQGPSQPWHGPSRVEPQAPARDRFDHAPSARGVYQLPPRSLETRMPPPGRAVPRAPQPAPRVSAPPAREAPRPAPPAAAPPPHDHHRR